MTPVTGPSRAPLPVVILISGRGSNMKTIAEHAASGQLPVTVRAVVSDQPQAGGLGTAAAMNIATHALSPREFPDRTSYDQALAALVSQYEPALVVLAGFMRILTPAFITPFATRMLNIHPSLLPKHRGLHTHQRVLDASDPLHGVSVHFVTEELDGGPVIIQARIPVRPNDTASTLSARIQRQEHRIYPQAIEWFAQGRIELRGDQVWMDGSPMSGPIIVEESV